MKKNNGLIIAIYLIILVIYNVLTFILCKNLNPVFWCSYGFLAVTYILHVVVQLIFTNETNKNKQFIKLPMFILSSLFVFVQLIINVVFMDLKEKTDIKTVAVVHGICLAIYVISLLIFIVIKNSTQKRTDEIKQNTLFIKGVSIDIEMMMRNCGDAEIKETLGKLHDVVLYSDPMSNKYVEAEEEQIMENMMELKSSMAAGDFVTSGMLCYRLRNLFEERNKKILATK